MEKLIHKFINQNIKNVDTYQHNGSTWLIFTDSKKWVIEITNEGTLWYNYNFFKSIFEFFSMDVVENQNYITEWVEDTIQNWVKETHRFGLGNETEIEDAIVNGVKDTKNRLQRDFRVVEDTIQNGVKETGLHKGVRPLAVNNTIHNGVKQTYSGGDVCKLNTIEDTIQNGVKDTKNRLQRDFRVVEDTIENGVKQTQGSIFDNPTAVKDTIQNGIKKTKTPIDGCLTSTMEWMEENKTNSVPKLIDYVVKYGVKKTEHEIASREWKIGEIIKEVQPLPAQDGNRDWGNYYHGKEDRTKPFNEYLNETIKFGVKKTKHMDEWVNTDNIITKVIKDGKNVL